MKTTVTLTFSDPEFGEFCGRAWALFHDSERFDAARDWIALGVSTSRSPRIRRLIDLCELVRACQNSQDFEHRLSIRRYHSAELRELYATMKQLVGSSEEESVDEEMFAFLQRLHAASFDLDQDASQDKARTLGILSLAASETMEMASSCWNAAFEFISAGAGKAKHVTEPDFRRLASQLGIKHPIDQLRESRLADLRRHCDITRGQIEPRLRVTGLHLDRSSLLDEIRKCMDESRIVLVRGSAGSGKSAAALEAGDACAGVTQVFCIRAEEFLHPHLDAALQAAGLREIGWNDWVGLLPGTTAVLIVDGIERLLQREESREAFADLLRAVQKESRWRLLLTCRESLAETLHHELRGQGVPAVSVDVPLLTEEELDGALVGTRLARVVERQPSLRWCLMNLKWLDLSLLALQEQTDDLPVTWSTESAWRKHLWHRLVLEKDGVKRERCLLYVAQARLQSAEGWVAVPESLVDVAEALAMAGLLRKAGTRFAPAHDLIEDWALLTHLDHVAMAAQGSLKFIIQEVGNLPLMRTCFRHWLGERLDDGQTDAFVWLEAGLVGDEAEGRWREETMLSLLGSREASTILRKTASHWLADGGRLFVELLRCLQVAYVATDERGIRQPRGLGWAAVLDFVAEQGRAWISQHLVAISKMLMLWKSSVTPDCPEPPGLPSAARIVLMIWDEITELDLSFAELINGRRGYLHDEDHPLSQLISSVAAELPASFFERLLESIREEDESRWHRSGAADKVLSSVTGTYLSYPLARSNPELVIQIFRLQWGLTPSPRTERRNLYSLERGLLGNGDDSSRSSAFVGPFLAMFRHRRDLGLAFILEVLNFSIQEEVASGGDGIDPPEHFEFELDGHSFAQWGHQGWWRAYRGWSPQHYLEESALMALEKWLLEEVSLEDGLEAICLDLVQRSQNVAITAVVASVATAHSRRFTIFPLLVLQQPRLISLDRHRYLNDETNKVARELDDSHYDLKKERHESDHLPHRHIQLEHYIIDAQFGPACEGIQASLTAWGESLAKVDVDELSPQEADELGVLRLLMHRMDMRNLAAYPMNDGTGRVALMPTRLPAELESIVTEAGQSFVDRSERQSAFLWAARMFDKPPTADPKQWREMLAAARKVVLTDPSDELFFGTLPAQVAAACVTFFWREMTPDEVTWCCETLGEYLRGDEPLTTWSGRSMPIMRGMDFGYVAHGLGVACARLDMEHPLKRTCSEACAIAITHPEKNVAKWAASGLARVTEVEGALKLQLLAAALMFDHARADHEINYKFRGPNNPPELSWEERRAAMNEELLFRVRSMRLVFVEGVAVDHRRLGRTFVKGFTGHQRLAYTLELLLHHKGEVARRVFERAARWLFCSWAEGAHRPRRRRGNDELHLRGRDSRNPVTIGAVGHVLAQRAMLQPDEGMNFVRSLIWKLRIIQLRENAREILDELVLAADSCGEVETFWALWRQCRDAARIVGHALQDEALRRQAGISEEETLETYSALLPALFFNGMNFRENDSWKPMAGRECEVQEAFTLFGPIALRHFIRFLITLGAPLLPQAWERMADSVARLQGKVPLSAVITPSCYPALLRLIQAEISQRRIPSTNRKTWSFIQQTLDELTNQGSAEAFHLRETMIQLRLNPP